MTTQLIAYALEYSGVPIWCGIAGQLCSTVTARPAQSGAGWLYQTCNCQSVPVGSVSYRFQMHCLENEMKRNRLARAQDFEFFSPSVYPWTSRQLEHKVAHFLKIWVNVLITEETLHLWFRLWICVKVLFEKTRENGIQGHAIKFFKPECLCYQALATTTWR